MLKAKRDQASRRWDCRISFDGRRDKNPAACIPRCCSILLNEEWDKAEDCGKRLIQAARRFFVESDEQDGDLEPVDGFDDHAELVSEIPALLYRPDLAIQI